MKAGKSERQHVILSKNCPVKYAGLEMSVETSFIAGLRCHSNWCMHVVVSYCRLNQHRLCLFFLNSTRPQLCCFCLLAIGRSYSMLCFHDPKGVLLTM